MIKISSIKSKFSPSSFFISLTICLLQLKTGKPWGYEEILELNKYYCLKKLFMKNKHRCSLQYHKKKIESIIVVKGILKVTINKKKKKI